jgi:hypothetical protein
MGVNSLHPEITTQRLLEWQVMRDTFGGEREVKSRGEVYLPMPSGFRAMSDGGLAAYSAYRMRADFPEIVAPAIAAMVGIVHSKESQITMPDSMEWVWENADGHGLSLEAFHRRITRHLLWLGRYGVMADAPMDGGDPFLVGYAAEAVINWDKDWYVLDESYLKRTGFAWDRVDRFRVLYLDGGRYVSEIHEGDAVEVVTPSARGARPLDVVPFVVGNARDLVPDIETPPLIGAANAALGIYRNSADYELQLFMSSQPTLVALNGDAPKIVGSGVVHEMKGAGDFPPDLKYVSPPSEGMEEKRAAMKEKRASAAAAGAKMFQQEERSQESGEARKLRFAAETASLMSVALVSAGLLEKGLRYIAMMQGLNPSDVVVAPPKDLMDTTMNPQELASLFQVYEGGGMSWQTYYEAGQRGGIMSPERDHEAEFALIDDPGADEDALVI